MSVCFDTTEWPLLSVTMSGPTDVIDNADLLDGLERHLLGGRCAVILDMFDACLADFNVAQQNLRQEANWLRDHQALVERHVVSAAFVIGNPATRFLFSGLLSLATMPTAYVVGTSHADARRFCLQSLAEHLDHGHVGKARAG